MYTRNTIYLNRHNMASIFICSTTPKVEEADGDAAFDLDVCGGNKNDESVNDVYVDGVWTVNTGMKYSG